MRRDYQIIYADPPWSYRDKSTHRGGAERHYRTMNAQDIGYMHVAGICDDDAVMFLWATHPLMCQGGPQFVAKRWGFELKTCAFDWVKTTRAGDISIGMGHWSRANSEPCYIGTRGRPQRMSAAVRQIVEAANTGADVQPEALYAPRREHSRKPDCVRDRIVELCGDVPRIELFARGPAADGWDTWGNEAELAAVVPL